MLGLSLLILSQSTDFGVRQLGHTPPPAKAQTSRQASTGANFNCVVQRITDGDTLRCSDGTKVRVAGIDAPEVSECRPGRQCVAGDAEASKRSLATLAAGRTLKCERV